MMRTCNSIPSYCALLPCSCRKVSSDSHIAMPRVFTLCCGATHAVCGAVEMVCFHGGAFTVMMEKPEDVHAFAVSFFQQRARIEAYLKDHVSKDQDTSSSVLTESSSS
jgi:hypothetical protein